MYSKYVLPLAVLYVAIIAIFMPENIQCGCCGGSSGGSSYKPPKRNRKTTYKDRATKVQIEAAEKFGEEFGKLLGQDVAKVVTGMVYGFGSYWRDHANRVMHKHSMNPKYQLARAWTRVFLQGQLLGHQIPLQWGEQAYRSAVKSGLILESEDMNPLSVETTFQASNEKGYVSAFMNIALYNLDLHIGENIKNYYYATPRQRRKLIKHNQKGISHAFYLTVMAFYHHTLKENMSLGLWGNLYTLVKISSCPLGAYVTRETISSSIDYRVTRDTLLRRIGTKQTTSDLMNSECNAFKEAMLLFLENPQYSPASNVKTTITEGNKYLEMNDIDKYMDANRDHFSELYEFENQIKKDGEEYMKAYARESEMDEEEESFEDFQAAIKDEIPENDIVALKEEEEKAAEDPNYHIPLEKAINKADEGVKPCCRHNKKNAEIRNKRAKDFFRSRSVPNTGS